MCVSPCSLCRGCGGPGPGQDRAGHSTAEEHSGCHGWNILSGRDRRERSPLVLSAPPPSLQVAGEDEGVREKAIEYVSTSLMSMRHILFIPHPDNEKHLVAHIKKVGSIWRWLYSPHHPPLKMTPSLPPFPSPLLLPSPLVGPLRCDGGGV